MIIRNVIGLTSFQEGQAALMMRCWPAYSNIKVNEIDPCQGKVHPALFPRVA